MRFAPSLVMSALVNLAVFSAIQPLRVAPGEATGRYRLQRLRHVTVRPSASTAMLPLSTPPPAPSPDPEPVTARRTRPTAAAAPPRNAVRGPRNLRAGGGGPAATPATGPTRRAAGPLGPPAPVAPPAHGGDGSQVAAAAPQAGAGAIPTARPLDAGNPLAREVTGPAFSGVGLRQPAGDPTTGHGRPRLMPGLAAGGGTPLAPQAGVDPIPGTAGSGDRPHEVAPLTLAGYQAPPVPTTPGPRLRSRPGTGLPQFAQAPVEVRATPIDPTGHSGGGGGTAAVPGDGGGGPPLGLAATDRNRYRGGGGSGQTTTGPRPGAPTTGPGVGGGGGGGDGLAPVGDGLAGYSGQDRIRPAATGGAPSILQRDAFGDPGGAAAAPGKRQPGPGGTPVAAPLQPVRPTPLPGAGQRGGSPDGPGRGGPGRAGGQGGGNGRGNGRGDGDGDGDGDRSMQATAVSRGKSGSSGFTGAVINSLALTWHHYPTSYDLRIGSADGPLVASIGVYRYPSVPAAQASQRVTRDGRREVMVINPLALEFAKARQIVVISASDAARLRESGLLKEQGRILTVYKRNY